MEFAENKEKESMMVRKKETITANPHLTSQKGSATLGKTTYNETNFAIN